MKRVFFTYQKEGTPQEGKREEEVRASYKKNDEHRKKEVCPLTCLIKINDWTHYHSRNTLQKERKSDRGREGEMKGQQRERMIKRDGGQRVREEVKKEKREEGESERSNKEKGEL